MKLATPRETEMLAMLERLGPTAGAVLASRLRGATGEAIAQGSFYSTLDRLRLRGWITISSHGSDGRFRTYALADPGGKALASARSRYARLAAFNGFTTTEGT